MATAEVSDDRLEDYALIGDCETAALVSRSGSVDWLPLPRFDSGACFAKLLGEDEHGSWRIAPVDDVTGIRRYYLDETLILKTEFATATGRVLLVDFMPPRDGRIDMVRLVRGLEGRVTMRFDLALRFDYGSIVPWVRRVDDRLVAVAGPDSVYLDSDIECHGRDFRTVADFTVEEGQTLSSVLTWRRSAEEPPPKRDPRQAFDDTVDFWRKWSGRCTYEGPWQEAVLRSLITLKALTYAPTGGIVAAPTTSLPETLGGSRNWDYRFCWLRDATFALYALLVGGYEAEARAWREWLVRAVAGKPSELQIMYGLAGERRLTEIELEWLPGYDRSAPVRTGNAASKQHQLDVYGEVMDTLHYARRAGLHPDEDAWRVQRAIMDFLEQDWQRSDMGIWEIRGESRHFTHSKIMAWVAADRAVKAVEHFELDGPIDRWKKLREKIFHEVCDRGYDPELGAFVQAYGSRDLDASLLMIPLVGFLPATDERVVRTVAAIEQRLTHDGFVHRYDTSTGVDALGGQEGAFLICSFWLADNLALQGRREEAKHLFERLLALRNDVGLLSEQYDTVAKRFLGNFPQAFSHVALVNTARNLTRSGGPAEHRALAPAIAPRTG